MNKTGKGGFKDNPENINKDGQPLKGDSLIDKIRERGDEWVLDGEKRVQRKELLAKTLWSKAIVDEDIQAIREILDRFEGKPKQSSHITGDINIPPATIVIGGDLEEGE